jgi:hypothetical protein
MFPPQLEVVERSDLEKSRPSPADSVRNPEPYDHSNPEPRPAMLVAKLRKRPL